LQIDLQTIYPRRIAIEAVSGQLPASGGVLLGQPIRNAARGDRLVAFTAVRK
jgi:hypothetical protein